MSSFPREWSINGVVPAVSQEYGYIDTTGSSTVTCLAFSSTAFVIEFEWSMDGGVNVDFIDSSGTVA